MKSVQVKSVINFVSMRRFTYEQDATSMRSVLLVTLLIVLSDVVIAFDEVTYRLKQSESDLPSSRLPSDIVSNLLDTMRDEMAMEGESDKVVPSKKLYSSPFELLQSERPSGALANFMGTFFASTSYPLASDDDSPSLISSPTGLSYDSGRRKRSSSSKIHRSSTQPLENVCDAVDQWVSKGETKDWLGNTVHVLPKIDFNGTKVNQYFHEIVCRRSVTSLEDEYGGLTRKSYSECNGIDRTKWRSECRENFVWTYAKVQSIDGEIGWVWIPVSGSCSCGIRQREQPTEPTTLSRRKESLYQKYCARYSLQQQLSRNKDKNRHAVTF